MSEIGIFEQFKDFPSLVGADAFAVTGATALCPKIQDAGFRRDLQVKIFPPQNVEFAVFELEEVLTFDKAFVIVAEVALKIFDVRVVESGELCSREDELTVVLNARDVAERLSVR